MRIIIARRSLSTKRSDTFSQTVLVVADSSCSSTADHTCYNIIVSAVLTGICIYGGMTFVDNFTRFNENLAAFDQALVNFIATEVSTSLTFARLARDARQIDKRERNLANAKKGYDTAFYFLLLAYKRRDRVSPDIVEGMKMLSLMLSEMGENPTDVSLRSAR